MKRIRIISCLVVLLVCSLSAHGQFWISFGWNEPHCQNCLWMEEALRLPARQAAEYHKIIHKYGQKIEREARRDCRYWEKAARKIYDLRMERDRKLQRLLTPSQFRMYVRFVRESPQRIHDYRGWYKNPHYPHYRPSHTCIHYEDHYWKHDWKFTDSHWDKPSRPHKEYKYEKRPKHYPKHHPQHPKHDKHRKDKSYDDGKWYKGKYEDD